MDRNLVARAAAVIDAPIPEVWRALVTPDVIRRYMFGTEVVSDWREGSPIVWKGSARSPACPTCRRATTPSRSRLHQEGDGRTSISLLQDNSSSEEVRDRSQDNWSMVLQALKRVLEELPHGEARPE